MVISVFPDYGSGFQAFERARGNRLQAEAARTEMDLRNRRQQAYNRMLEGLSEEQRSMYEALGPEQGVSLMLQDQRSQAERAGQARERQLEVVTDAAERFPIWQQQNPDADPMDYWDRQARIAESMGVPVQRNEAGAPSQFADIGMSLAMGRATPNADRTQLERIVSGLVQRGRISPERADEILMSSAEVDAGLRARPSARGGPMFEFTDPNTGMTIRYGEGGQLPPGAGTRAPGLGPATAGSQDRRIDALDASNVRAGAVDEYFRLTGRLTEGGAGGAGAGARLLQEAAAQLGGGVSLGEFLIKGDAELGPSIIARGNEILQDVTGLNAADTARLRSNQILVRSQLLPLVAGGLGQRFTDFENQLAAEVLGDVNNPATAFETMQGNRGAVLAALAVQDARAALAADRVPSYNVVLPNGEPNADGAREMMRVLTQDYGFSQDDAYEIYQGYARSLAQLYERPRRQLVEDVDAILAAQQELAPQ